LFLTGGIPALLAAVLVVVVPWWSVSTPSWNDLGWQGRWWPLPLLSLVVLFLALPAFTRMHQHRLRTTAGVDIPPQPAVGNRWSAAGIVTGLPAPFGPRKPVTTPGRTTKSSPPTASFSPYRLLRFSTSIIARFPRSVAPVTPARHPR
jgi:hypothetical protein